MEILSYQALYRKWRPSTFDEVLGQEHITETLKNEIKLGRVAHAYIFCGSRGTGKTSTARILSRAVNCLDIKDGNPCNECESCRGILDGRILDVNEIDAASNSGVEHIRDLREETRYVAADAKFRVYIIDEVHMLSTGAFNALLKVLEEPPEHIKFILATTESHKVPQTILSRCQRFDFRRIKKGDIAGLLEKIMPKENIAAEKGALRLIAERADGSMRDALSLFDQCRAFLGDELTYENVADFLGAAHSGRLFSLLNAIADNDAGAALSSVSALLEEGGSVIQTIVGFTEMARRLLILKAVGDDEAEGEEIALAGRFGYERLVHIIGLAAKAQESARFMPARVVWEIALIKMCLPAYDKNLEGYAARISQLEARLEGFLENPPAKRGKDLPKAEGDMPKAQPEGDLPKAEGDMPKTQPEGDLPKAKKAPKTGGAACEIDDEKWREIMKLVMEKNLMSLFGALCAATPATDEGQITLCFGEECFGPYKRIVDANHEDLKAALIKVLGGDFKIACTKAQGAVENDSLKNLLESGAAEEF